MRLSLPNYTEILVPSRVGIQLSFHRINLPLNKTVIWKINLFDLIEIKYNLIQSVNRLLRSGNAPRASFGKISSAVKSWPLKNQSNWENITPRDATNRILTFKISNNVLGLLFPQIQITELLHNIVFAEYISWQILSLDISLSYARTSRGVSKRFISP